MANTISDNDSTLVDCIKYHQYPLLRSQIRAGWKSTRCDPIKRDGIEDVLMTELLAAIAETVGRDGFAFVRAPEMHSLLETAGLRDWGSFAASWDDLGVDAYMADGGRYRRRRFAAFRASSAGIVRKPHQPHYQSRDYNPLNGGVQRWFEPVTDAIGAHPALAAILR